MSGEPGGGASGPRGTLRAAVVCPYDLSVPGGVQGQVVGLAAALRQRGHEVIVVAPDDRPPGWATGVYAAGRAVGVRANGSVAPVALSPVAAARALRAVGDWGADVVHLHEPLAPILGYGFLLGRRWPMVGTFHRSGVTGGARVLALPARWARGRIDVCCAVSEAARDTAAALYGGTYEVLFNGVAIERFAGAEPTRGAGPALLYLGRHEPRKGLEVLLEAFDALSARGALPPHAELWVAGAGPETARLRAKHRTSSALRWLGVIGDDEVASRLAGAAALCAPSLGGESFGMVLVEAMAAGCPVVASDIAGYREASAGHARLVPPGDVHALADALLGVLQHPPPPEARRAAAAHAGRWSMAGLAARYEDLYARAVSARTGDIVAGQ